MALIGDDCYFFCTSTCAKGKTCPFRHVEAGKTAKIICQHWQMGHCLRPMCKFRHSTFEIPKVPKTDLQCYWETQPFGCTRPDCMYRHSKPRPDGSQALTAEGTSVDTSPVNTKQSETPQVKPVIIQPADSEESNTSPVKKRVDTVDSSKGAGDIESEPASLKNPKTAITANNCSVVKELDLATKQGDLTKNATVLSGESELPVKTPVKKTGVRKTVKKGNLSEKKKVVRGRSSEGKKVVAKKKVVKAKPAITSPVVSASPGRARSLPRPVSTKPSPKPARAARSVSAKSRLGVPLSKIKPSKKEESSEESDSDDSIENINVLSVEEILRRKALESMMKKRADEGKELMPQARTEPRKTGNIVRLSKPNIVRLKPQPASQRPPVSPPAKNFLRKNSGLRTRPKLSVKDGTDTGEEASMSIFGSQKKSSSSSEESESSDESSSESEESSDSEPTVRRVIIDEEEEKAARKRAKASLLSRQKQAAAVEQREKLHKTATGRVGKAPNRLLSSALIAVGAKSTASSKAAKKRTIISVEERLGGVKVPALSVRDRLGRQPIKAGVLERAARLVEAADAGVSSAGEGSPHRVGVRRVCSLSEGEEEAREAGEMSSEEEEDLSGIQVKTLEEIRLERLRKQKAVLGGTGHRGGSLSPPLRRKVDLSDDEDKKGRQVMIVTERQSSSPEKALSEEQKKGKRRQWRPQKVRVAPGEARSEEGSQSPPRTVDTQRAEPRAEPKPEPAAPEKLPVPPEVDLSPFELLKRRALERKIQQRQQALLERAAGVELKQESDDGVLEAAEQVVDTEGKRGKSHKHKHRHKHKKSKVERQIYMPPGMKSSGAMSQSPEEREDEFPDPPDDEAVQGRRGKKGPHRMAAAWTAGLSLSSKGTVPRHAERQSHPKALGSVGGDAVENLSAPAPPVSALQRLSRPVKEPEPALTGSADGGSVTIKSFSEIMAEKRKRRMEMQAAQKSGGDPALSSSLPSSLPPPSSAPGRGGPALSTSSISSPVRPASKSRAPITPITFDKSPPSSTSSSELSRPRSQFGSSTLPPTSRSISDTSPARLKQEPSAPSAVAAAKKSKKLFKKKKSSDNGASLGAVSGRSAVDSEPYAASSWPVSHEAPPESSSYLQIEDDELDLMPYESIDSPGAKPAVAEVQPVHPVPRGSTLTRKSSAENEVPVKKSRLSLDDELALDDLEEEGETEAQDETIDDLLQDIDDLLA